MPMFDRTRSLLVAAATLVLTASAVIGLHAIGAIPSTLGADAAVKITDSAYDPTTVTVTAGSVVTWTNTGAAIHTVTSETGDFDSGDLSGGAAFANLFDTPGTYPYHDDHNPALMKGTVIVTAAAPTPTGAGTPEPTPPPGTLPPGFGSPSSGVAPSGATAGPSTSPGLDANGGGSSGQPAAILLFAVAVAAIVIGVMFVRRRGPPAG